MKSVTVILNEDVYNLGEEGDVRDVAAGYARNYLIPRGLAVPYSKEYVALFEDKRSAIERRKEEKRTDALGLKERLEELELVFEVPTGESGKLFGSVTNAGIADRLMQEGIQIERKKIEIPGHTIKMTGEYEITIKLYADEAATLKVRIEPEGASKKAKAAESRGEKRRSAADEPEESGETEVSEQAPAGGRTGEAGDATTESIAVETDEAATESSAVEAGDSGSGVEAPAEAQQATQAEGPEGGMSEGAESPVAESEPELEQEASEDEGEELEESRE